MHQKQPPAKVAFSNLSSGTLPFVESPEALVASISIIPKMNAVSLIMILTPNRGSLSSPTKTIKFSALKVNHSLKEFMGKEQEGRIPLTILRAHRYMKIRAEEKGRRVCFGSGTEEVF
jgi:hypothetical protein